MNIHPGILLLHLTLQFSTSVSSKNILKLKKEQNLLFILKYEHYDNPISSCKDKQNITQRTYKLMLNETKSKIDRGAFVIFLH